MMNEAPERIWVLPAYRDSNGAEPMQITSKDFAHSAIEYTRADLTPRWRPIAELPEEWRDGRQVFVKRKRDWFVHVLDDLPHRYKPTHFLDFGGKAMLE